MNQTDITTTQEEQSSLSLSSSAKYSLLEAAKWSKFLAIMGLIGIGFMVIAGFAMGSIFSQFSQLGAAEIPFNTSIFGFTYLIMAVIYFFPIHYLYKFASKCKAAILLNSEQSLEDGLKYLGRHYKYIGVFTIAILSLYFIIIVAVVVFSTVFSSMMQG